MIRRFLVEAKIAPHSATRGLAVRNGARLIDNTGESILESFSSGAFENRGKGAAFLLDHDAEVPIGRPRPSPRVALPGARRGARGARGGAGATVRRALDKAKETASLDALEERLSMHALRHSFASLLATDLELAPTTLAQLIGHADAGFTLRVYARDTRDTAAVVADVLERAAGAGVGS